MNLNNSHQALNDTVIANGYCVDCGACAVPEESPFQMVMEDYEKICLFGAGASNEDEIASKHFSNTCEYNNQVGYYNGVYAGHVSECEFRKQGNSGGMGTWVLNELLSKGLVDYVVHIKSETSEQDIE